jgi:hypothetical protein
MLQEAKLEIDSIVDLIVKHKNDANWTCHSLSRAQASEPSPCTDREIAEFVNLLASGIEQANLTVSDIYWEESGGCVGDALYPVELHAVRLPDGRYYLRLEGLFQAPQGEYGHARLKEYILS